MKEKFKHLLAKVEEMKKSGLSGEALAKPDGVDLSTEEDLVLAVMNLISLEEHFFFTGQKSGKPEYFDLLGEVREMRKTLLAKMIDRHEGETWCIAKHLLATTMRLIEVGTKLRADGKARESEEVFDHAYKAYTLFWAIRLKLADLSDVKESAGAEKPWTLKDIVEKMVNCCDE